MRGTPASGPRGPRGSHGSRGTRGPRRPRRFDPAVVLIGLAGLAVVVAVAATIVRGVDEPAVAAAFGVLIAFGEAIRLRLPDDRVQAPIGLAGALSYAMLAWIPLASGGMEPMRHGVWQTVAVAALAMLIGALPHLVVGRAPELEGIARRVLVVAVVAAVVRPLVLDSGIGGLMRHSTPAYVGLCVLTILLAWPLEAFLAAVVRAGRMVGPFLALFRDELTAYLGIGSAIASTGILIALATREIGLWALPVVTIPLLLTQFAYRRYAHIRYTQIQTIRALSRATDVGGYTAPGHARRVAELALAVGRDLGMPESRLRLLQYAALMHDLGQLALADPIAGGATVVLPPDERRRIAELGAAVVRQTGVQEEIAVIVEDQAEPYRRPLLPDDTDVPGESRIIKVINAYDDLVSTSTADDSRLDAMETLRLGMAYEYDPRVVASLARVLERAEQ